MEPNNTIHGDLTASPVSPFSHCHPGAHSAAVPVPAAAHARSSTTKTHCWQYEIRLDNREQDLIDAGLTEQEAATIRVG